MTPIVRSVILFLLFSGTVWANEPIVPDAPPDDSYALIGPYPIDYPGIQRSTFVPSLYIDHTYEASSDLNTMGWVRGTGQNYRIAVGIVLRTDRLTFSAEIPVQYTRLEISALQEQPPIPKDRSKGAFSLGDTHLTAAFAETLVTRPVELTLGVGLRLRLPTHTMTFRFSLINEGSLRFGFPYYVHAAPTLIFGATKGPWTFTMNQGLLAMLAKDTTLNGIYQPIPNVYFMESHYALSLTLLPWLGAWVELTHCHQLNDIDVINFDRIRQLDALSLNPGVALRLNRYLLVLEARWGLTEDSQDFGVITFSGDRALLTRLSYLY